MNIGANIQHAAVLDYHSASVRRPPAVQTKLSTSEYVATDMHTPNLDPRRLYQRIRDLYGVL